eukprot:1144495-Pelagomonas_calceolata.AAC.3
MEVESHVVPLGAYRLNLPRCLKGLDTESRFSVGHCGCSDKCMTAVFRQMYDSCVQTSMTSVSSQAADVSKGGIASLMLPGQLGCARLCQSGLAALFVPKWLGAAAFVSKWLDSLHCLSQGGLAAPLVSKWLGAAAFVSRWLGCAVCLKLAWLHFTRGLPLQMVPFCKHKSRSRAIGAQPLDVDRGRQIVVLSCPDPIEF